MILRKLLLPLIGFMIGVLILSACDIQAATPVPTELVVLGYENFKLAPHLKAQFEQENNIRLRVMGFNSAELMLNQANYPTAEQGDVVYGIDNQLLAKALRADLFEAYTPTQVSQVPPLYQLDPTHRLIPTEIGYVTLAYDKDWFIARQGYVNPPASLSDLVSADNKEKLFHKFVMPHPRKSPVGYAFLLATIAAFPESSAYPWQQFWRDMQQRLVHVTDTWQQAYAENFTVNMSDKNEGHPLVVTFASSPAADVMLRKVQQTPMAILTNSAFIQPRFAGIRKGTKARKLAEKFIDFTLSEAFQREVPNQMYNYPVLPNVPLPDAFAKFAPRPTQELNIDPNMIDSNKEAWVHEWGKLLMMEE